MHVTGAEEEGGEEDARQPTAAFPVALHRRRSEAAGAEDQAEAGEAESKAGCRENDASPPGQAEVSGHFFTSFQLIVPFMFFVVAFMLAVVEGFFFFRISCY